MRFQIFWLYAIKQSNQKIKTFLTGLYWYNIDQTYLAFNFLGLNHLYV